MYVGTISYSLYLWHWGILALGRWALPPEPWALVLQAGLIMAAALISFHWVERPLRSLFSAQRLSPWVARLLMSAGLIGVAGLFIVAGRVLKTNLFAFGSRLSPWAFPGANVIKGFDVKPQAVDCFLSQPVFDAQCVLLRGEQANREAVVSIYLLGDSHANNHLGSLVQASLQLNQRSDGLAVRQVANDSWIVCNERTSMHPGEFCSAVLERQRLTSEKLKAQLRPGDLVVFSYARDRVMHASATGLPRQPDWEQLGLLRQGLTDLARLVASQGAVLVLVEDIPKICADDQALLFGVIKRGQAGACQEDAAVSRLDRQPLSDLYKELASRYSNLEIVDFHDHLCPGVMCSALLATANGQQLLFGDVSPHFTNNSQTLLAPEWLLAITKIASRVRS